MNKRFILVNGVAQARVVHTPVHTWQVARSANDLEKARTETEERSQSAPSSARSVSSAENGLQEQTILRSVRVRARLWTARVELDGPTQVKSNLAVTANTYTHVLVDETEIDYAALVS